MKRIVAVLLLAVLAFTGGFYVSGFASGPSAPPPSSGPQGFTENWQTAFDAGDFDALRDMYEPDAWLMAQGQPARKGVDDIITYLTNLKNSGMTADVETADEELVIDGNYAFSTTQWWFEYERKNGDILRDAGRAFMIFKRGEDGTWRLWRAVKNQSPDVEFRETSE